MAKKPLNQQQISSSDQGSKPETPRPSGMGPTTRQLRKSKKYIGRKKRENLFRHLDKERMVATNENPTTKENKPSDLRSGIGGSGSAQTIGNASIVIRLKV